MIHNTQHQAPALKQCRVIFNTQSHEFKTSRFEELVDYIKKHHIYAYIPSTCSEPNVVYLDALIIFNNRNEYRMHKEKLEEFEER